MASKPVKLRSLRVNGGFDYSFVDKELDKYTCSICTLVFRDPHLTGCCGQHFCESCLENWFIKCRKKSCPVCRKKFEHILDKKFRREINSLRIHCTNKKEGCQWIGELDSLKEHIESAKGCGYVEVVCPNKCKVPIGCTYVKTKTMQRRALANHLKKECYRRSYTCEHCGYNDTYVAITGHHPYRSVRSKSHHYTKCPEFPLECPNECGRNDIKRRKMSRHRSQCPEEEVECPFEEAGCKKKLVRRELEQHMSATQQQHLLMVMGAYKEMKKENQEIKKENSRIQDTLEDTQDELDDLKKKLNRKRKRTDSDSDSDSDSYSDSYSDD